MKKLFTVSEEDQASSDMTVFPPACIISLIVALFIISLVITILANS